MSDDSGTKPNQACPVLSPDPHGDNPQAKPSGTRGLPPGYKRRENLRALGQDRQRERQIIRELMELTVVAKADANRVRQRLQLLEEEEVKRRSPLVRAPFRTDWLARRVVAWRRGTAGARTVSVSVGYLLLRSARSSARRILALERGKARAGTGRTKEE